MAKGKKLGTLPPDDPTYREPGTIVALGTTPSPRDMEKRRADGTVPADNVALVRAASDEARNRARPCRVRARKK